MKGEARVSKAGLYSAVPSNAPASKRNPSDIKSLRSLGGCLIAIIKISRGAASKPQMRPKELEAAAEFSDLILLYNLNISMKMLRINKKVSVACVAGR